MEKTGRKKIDSLSSLNDPQDCPVARFLKILDGPWATLIVRELLAGSRRFGELQQSLVGISPKTLTARLRSLEASGILTRRAFGGSPPKVEYTLTAAGMELEHVLIKMAEWATSCLPRGAVRKR